MIHAWSAFPVGIIISTIVTAFGIGGGILWMPFFLIIIGLPPEAAVITSMLIQTAGKGSGVFAYHREGFINRKLALYLLVISIPSITFGALLSNMIPPTHIELILGLLMMLNAFSFVSTSQKQSNDSTQIPTSDYKKLSIAAIIVSFTSGMLSTGIGEWLIPIMRSQGSMTMRVAIATSISITFGICLIGAGIHILIGAQPDFFIVIWAVPGVIIGGQIGPRIMKKIDERLLKEAFIFLLTLVGIHLIYNAF